MRDFARSKTEPFAANRFRLCGKRSRCVISLLLEIVAGARFHFAGNGPLAWNRFRLFGKNVADARFRLFWKSRHMRDFTFPENEPLAGKRLRLCGKRPRCAIPLILDIVGDARFRLYRKRSHWPKTMSLIWETRTSHDFANFGNRWRCAISLDRETEPLAGKRFRLFIKRCRCALSLILEIMSDSRFHLATSGERLTWGDFAYLVNVVGARFRQFWKSRHMRYFDWSGDETINRGRFRLFWKRGRCAISLISETVSDV